MNEEMLRAQELSVGYEKRVVLEGVEFSVNKREIVTLIGPNGSGKSTVLKSITRQLEPLGGVIFIGNEDIGKLKESDISKKMSILMTERLNTELMTCEELVGTGRYPYTGRLGILSKGDYEKVAEAMEIVKVTELAGRYFHQLSDGQRQRVMLARAICQEPDVLVMDEPTSFLDIRHKLELLSILKELVREKDLAVLMSLHELDLVSKISDKVVCVKDGAAQRYGLPEEIFSVGYIDELYDIDKGHYVEEFGSVELVSAYGEPEVFVIGGGGSAIATYRRLQREGVSFAVGVLHENDVEYPLARAMAAEVVSERAFEVISEEKLMEALEVLKRCDKTVCCVEHFGGMNFGNKRLVEWAKENGRLVCKV